MDLSRSDLIRPLRIAENRFLQILLSRFVLKRHGDGVLLEVEFDDNSPTIWTGEGKRKVLQMMGVHFERQCSIHQSKLDSFLLDKRGEEFFHDDAEFPFRYASGGTLPILRMGGKEYYCLFYRDIFPVGWNIANGGCDTRDELLNPYVTVERELREELIVVNPKRRRRYVFEGDADKPLDRPEFAIAREIWRQHLHQFDIPNFGELRIPIKWLDGPDSLSVRFGNTKKVKTRGYFLNINAEDFGIEVDKVARMSLDPDDHRNYVLCDGEVVRGHLINRPVGLFPTDRMEPEMIEAGDDFVPDKFFYDGRLYEGKFFKDVVVKQFIPYVSGLRRPEINAEWRSTVHKYSLCPVTRRIIKRYMSLPRQKETHIERPFDVFISFGSEDKEFASKVCDFLTGRRKTVFFSPEDRSFNFGRAIDDALISTRSLVAVGTSPLFLSKRWVDYEYRTFHHSVLYDEKNEKQLLSFISGFDPRNLPLPLRTYDAIEVSDPQNLEPELDELNGRLSDRVRH